MLVISGRKGCGGRGNLDFGYNATLVTRIIAFVNMRSLTYNNALDISEWALIVLVDFVLQTMIVFLPIDMQQHQCAMSWKAHKGEVYSVDFSYDENAVYSIGEDGKVSIWVEVVSCVVHDNTACVAILPVPLFYTYPPLPLPPFCLTVHPVEYSQEWSESFRIFTSIWCHWPLYALRL